MSQNSSNKIGVKAEKAANKPERHWWMLIVIPVWVIVAFFLCQIIAELIVISIMQLAPGLLSGMNQIVFLLIISAVVYVATLAATIGLPWWIRKNKTSKQELGVKGLPTWIDIVLTPASFIIYLIISAIIMIAAQAFLPWFDTTQEQNLGFESLHFQYEYIVAFLMLVVVAPIAEELIFRGYLYGKLRKAVPIWAAAIMTSIVFGVAHRAWNVGFDTFALSLVLCSLREITGTIWAPILLHMAKNGLAFYLLFISPVL